MGGCLLNGIKYFVIILIIALILDAITLALEYWWVLLLVILLIIAIILLIMRRRGKFSKNGKRPVSFRKLIKAAASDGVITPKEREILIQNMVNDGFDRDEAEIMVDARLKKHNVRVDANAKKKSK
ncbi:MAG: hypothetical protein IKV14_03545 [Muribaculaceae bacterium]|nr:hypothetical protein [Muribaculaceae bacterium]